MHVFISFSGRRSRRVAEALKEWLPQVLQAIGEPFMSTDIPKGKNWPAEVSAALEKCRFGIVCLTPENIAEPWILFEGGSLSKALTGNACPYLLELQGGDVPPPLGLLQAARANRGETLKLVKDLNKTLPDESRLSDGKLERAFEKWWPDLEEKLKAAAASEKHERHERGLDEKVDEILELLRSQSPRDRPLSRLGSLGSLLTLQRIKESVSELEPGSPHRVAHILDLLDELIPIPIGRPDVLLEREGRRQAIEAKRVRGLVPTPPDSDPEKKE